MMFPLRLIRCSLDIVVVVVGKVVSAASDGLITYTRYVVDRIRHSVIVVIIIYSNFCK